MTGLNTWYVLAGGPSVAVCLPDPSILPPEKTIVVNNSYKLVPNADTLVFADSVWWDDNCEDVMSKFHGRQIITTAPDMDYWYCQRFGVRKCERLADDGISTVDGALNGLNGGHIAINLAIHQGATDIVMIGLDMLPNVKRTQWHNDHSRPTNTSMYVTHFIPAFEKLSRFLPMIDVKVWNVNPASGVKCFPYMPLCKFIHKAPFVSAEEILDFSQS